MHIQCQVTFESKVKSKKTNAINVQYEFNSTREALRQIRSSDENYIIEKLTTQSLVVKSIWEFLDSKIINQWSNATNHLPRNTSVSRS